jgi:2-phospho-L-lactate guanylyltransferase
MMIASTCWALIPVKTRAARKGRLAAVLTPAQRQQMAALMLDDVIAALRAAEHVAGIAIVSDEELPQHPDVLHLADPGQGLNAAVTAGVAALASRGIGAVLVLHGDLPLLTGPEVDALIAAGRATGLALAPDRREEGTNAIYLAPPTGFEFHFGHLSYGRHRAEAARAGRTPATLKLPGLSFDVDEATDLEQLIARGGQRYAFLPGALRKHPCPATPTT